VVTIELNLPDMLVRKVKALSALVGATDIDDIIVDLMDRSITDEIAGLLGITAIPVQAQPAPEPRPAPILKYKQEADELIDGLGDEDESDPPPVGNMYDLVPKGASLSDKSLDEDMDVSDPEHEAKAEAPDYSPSSYGHAGELFSNMMGLPAFDTPEEYEVDPRVSRRKRKLNIKGRVMPATSVQESF